MKCKTCEYVKFFAGEIHGKIVLVASKRNNQKIVIPIN